MHRVEDFWLETNIKTSEEKKAETDGIRSDPLMLSQIIVKSGTYQGIYDLSLEVVFSSISNL